MRCSNGCICSLAAATLSQHEIQLMMFYLNVDTVTDATRLGRLDPLAHLVGLKGKFGFKSCPVLSC